MRAAHRPPGSEAGNGLALRQLGAQSVHMSWIFGTAKRRMVEPDEALPGHDDYLYEVPTTHAVLGTPLRGPWSDTTEVLYVAMGCFWGSERKFWQLPGVVSTAVGYQGGFSTYPTYEETCTARTGHTETVMIAYEPSEISTYELLKVFWENHDPTQMYQQGNDVGTQYRSAIFYTTDDQRELIESTRDAYAKVLADRGFDPITTQIAPADGLPFYYAEDYHQQYLYKVPHGYDCHSSTGITLPALSA